METSELLKRVRKIEIKTRGLSKHLFAGQYHSAFKGRGMSFSEVRDYQYGDDVRNIDWNVTARTGQAHIKVFEEERELTVMLLVDVSGSIFFGTHAQMKNELATELCATLAFSAILNNDKVGVLFFSDKIEKYIPPKKGRKHILRIIRELIDFEPSGKETDMGYALRYFNNLQKKHSILFLISDYMATDYQLPLRIASRRHDVIGIRLSDQAEEKIPELGLVHVLDPESGQAFWLDSNKKQNREQYARYYEETSQYFKTAFLQAGAAPLHIRTGESYALKLLQFFKQRTHHR